MAGRKHHHIWQHIQRGFSVSEFNDHHIWVYCKSGKIDRTVTRLHGQEKFFYGPENSAADTNLTNLEAQLAGFAAEARVARTGTLLDSQMAGVLVTSMEARSAFLRVEFSRLLERTLEHMRSHMNSPGVMAKYMQACLKREPDSLAAELEKIGVDPGMHRALGQIFHDVIPKELASRKSDISAILDKIFGPILERTAEASKDGQIKALEREFSGTERTLGSGPIDRLEAFLLV